MAWVIFHEVLNDFHLPSSGCPGRVLMSIPVSVTLKDAVSMQWRFLSFSDFFHQSSVDCFGIGFLF